MLKVEIAVRLQEKARRKPLEAAAIEIDRISGMFIRSLNLDLDCHIARHPGQVPDLTIQFSGPDVSMLASDDEALLNALAILFSDIRSPDRPELLSCKTVRDGDKQIGL